MSRLPENTRNRLNPAQSPSVYPDSDQESIDLDEEYETMGSGQSDTDRIQLENTAQDQYLTELFEEMDRPDPNNISRLVVPEITSAQPLPDPYEEQYEKMPVPEKKKKVKVVSLKEYGNFQSKFWCFTAYWEDRLPEDCLLYTYDYLVYQQEQCPTTGKVHFQGYVCFTKIHRFERVKSLLFDAHVEPRKKKHSVAKKYCMKDETRIDGPWEFGDDEGISEGAGQRNDLEEAKKIIDSGGTMLEVAENNFGSFIRYHKGFEKYQTLKMDSDRFEETKNDFKAFSLRDWQKDCVKRLKSQGDRKILWYYDPVGGKGKSKMADYLEAELGAYVVTGGKHQDIAHAFNYQEYVVFDLCRGFSEHKEIYALIEKFKDKRVFSSKYESKTKRAPSCQLVVFSNFYPTIDESTLSADRLEIIHLE